MELRVVSAVSGAAHPARLRRVAQMILIGLTERACIEGTQCVAASGGQAAKYRLHADVIVEVKTESHALLAAMSYSSSCAWRSASIASLLAK